jgi:hypothetical protein
MSYLQKAPSRLRTEEQKSNPRVNCREQRLTLTESMNDDDKRLALTSFTLYYDTLTMPSAPDPVNTHTPEIKPRLSGLLRCRQGFV